MNNETKQLFDAPWTIKSDGDVYFSIWTEDDDCICDGILMFDNAVRITHLPELYDALKEAVEEACQDCVDETFQRTGMVFKPVTDGCIYPERDCCPKSRSWIDLLRKVRDGE